MKSVFALLALCITASLASDVLDLTGDNFDQALKDHSSLIVKFYAPWCGHCKSLAPIWEEIATDLADDGIAVAKVDVTVEEGLGSIYQIQGFPTLKFFKNGEFHSDYKGPRTHEALTSFLVKKSGKAYTTISSFAEAEEILAAASHGVVVGYFDDLEDEEFKEFEAAADESESVQFLVVSDASSASSCELKEEGGIVVLAKDGSKHHFDGNVEDELAAFVGEFAFPQSMDLDPELFQSMLAGNVIIVNAYDFEAEGAAEHRAMGEEVVKGLNVKQMYADVQKWGKALVRMGVVSGEVYPTFVAFDGRGEKQAPVAWHEDQAVTREGFAEWVKNVVAGTQEAWMKSEAIPEENNEAVKVVVQKQYEEIVLDSEKDVLVMFYAPWCGHCKNMAPIFDSVATHFGNDENIVVAKMDATANYVDPALGVQGFPTLKFFPAGTKNDVVTYEGDRTLGDFIEFVNANRNTQA